MVFCSLPSFGHLHRIYTSCLSKAALHFLNGHDLFIFFIFASLHNFRLFECSLCSELSAHSSLKSGLFGAMVQETSSGLEVILVIFPYPSSLSCFDSFFLSHKACILFCVSFLCKIPYHVPWL